MRPSKGNTNLTVALPSLLFLPTLGVRFTRMLFM
jgi:hypothetical protein